jgi:hypothetical protein
VTWDGQRLVIFGFLSINTKKVTVAVPCSVPCERAPGERAGQASLPALRCSGPATTTV